MMIFAALTSYAFAGEAALVTDRPDIAESSLTVGRGTYQLEQGALVNTVDGVTDVRFPSLHRYGIAEDLEFRLETPILFAGESGAGFDGIALGLKWHLRDGGTPGDGPSVALLVHGSMDADGVASPIGKLLVDTQFLGLDVGANVGSSLDADTRTPQFDWAVSASTPLNQRTRVFVEGAGFEGLESRETGIDGGFLVQLTHDLQWDISARQSLRGDAGWYVGTGISARFSKPKTEEQPTS